MSLQLRGEQRENRGYRPATGRTSGGKPYRVEGRLVKELISRPRCRICREKGHGHANGRTKGQQVPRDGEEAKKRSLSTLKKHNMPYYIGQKVIDTSCSRFLVEQKYLEKWERVPTTKWV